MSVSLPGDSVRNMCQSLLVTVEIEWEFVQGVARQTGLVLQRPAMAEDQGIRWEKGVFHVCT